MTTLTKEQFIAFQEACPGDGRLQALTFEKLIAEVGDQADLKAIPFPEKPPVVLEGSTFDCVTAVGFVVYDAVCLFLGAGALRGGATEAEAKAIGKAAEPVLSQMEQYIKTLSKGGSASDTAWAIWGIIKTVYNGGCLGAVISAFLSSLTWYNAILYSATALATIVAALATDGAAEVAAIVIELATFGFLVSDGVNAVDACYS